MGDVQHTRPFRLIMNSLPNMQNKMRSAIIHYASFAFLASHSYPAMQENLGLNSKWEHGLGFALTVILKMSVKWIAFINEGLKHDT